MWRCSNNINISSPSAKMCFINRAISFAYRMYKTPDPFLLQMIWQIQRQTHKKRVWYLGGGRCRAEDVFWKCLIDLCIFGKCWCSIAKKWKQLFFAISGIDSWQQRGLESFFAFDIPAGWHWWRGAGLSYSSLLTLKTAADQLTQQVAMMF